jgi:hypothetical protein
MRTVLAAVAISVFCASPCLATDFPVNHEGKVGDPGISQNIWAAMTYRQYMACNATGENEYSLACRKFYGVMAVLLGQYPVDAIIENPNASASRPASPSLQQAPRGDMRCLSVPIGDGSFATQCF